MWITPIFAAASSLYAQCSSTTWMLSTASVVLMGLMVVDAVTGVASLAIYVPILLSLCSFFLSPVVLSLVSRVPFLVYYFCFQCILGRFAVLVAFISSTKASRLCFFGVSKGAFVLCAPRAVMVRLFARSYFVFVFGRAASRRAGFCDAFF